jgi:hypothetical protein
MRCIRETSKYPHFYIGEMYLRVFFRMTSDAQLIGGPKNDTNLALKSIVALKAYGDILSSLGRSNHYSVRPLPRAD